jgi:hypothetical protein
VWRRSKGDGGRRKERISKNKKLINVQKWYFRVFNFGENEFKMKSGETANMTKGKRTKQALHIVYGCFCSCIHLSDQQVTFHTPHSQVEASAAG